MARFDRCVVCDYTAETGSSVANVGPRAHGKVRLRYSQMLCDVCNGSVGSVMEEHAKNDAAKEAEQNEQVEGEAHPVSVREEF